MNIKLTDLATRKIALDRLAEHLAGLVQATNR